MAKLNPNAEVPFPKTILIRKAAVDLVQYDEARELVEKRGEVVDDLSEPADAVDLALDAEML